MEDSESEAEVDVNALGSFFASPLVAPAALPPVALLVKGSSAEVTVQPPDVADLCLYPLDNWLLGEAIVSRLPAVYAVRLCVLSKAWHALCSRPGFWERQYQLRSYRSAVEGTGQTLWPFWPPHTFSLFRAQALLERGKPRLLGDDLQAHLRRGASLSSNGSTVAIVSEGGAGSTEVELRRVADGEFLRTFEADGDVTSVSFSPDGSALLVVCSQFAAIRRASDGLLLTTLREDGRHGEVMSASFSPNGLLVASISKDVLDKLQFTLWHAASGDILRTQPLENRVLDSDSPIRWARRPLVPCAPFFNPASALVATTSDGTAKLWNVASGQLVRTLEGRLRDVTSASFSPDGALVLTVHEGNRTSRSGVTLWRAADGEALRELHVWNSQIIDDHDVVAAASFSPNGLRVLAIVMEYTHKRGHCGLFTCASSVVLCNVADGRQVHRLPYKWHSFTDKSGFPSIPVLPLGSINYLDAAIFSSDSATILTSDTHNGVVLWLAGPGVRIPEDEALEEEEEEEEDDDE